ncbi:hypothetical protein XELAEV_18021277mg [Xenopus laevis]|uniref:Uncharacterized protein n=1 Tax=Xenopus laevis TaxID=8355 RepID=A0A974DA40_XENLA|nr:hypothetical protein XELAEV_18021277mg [Xenopus laevis]
MASPELEHRQKVTLQGKDGSSSNQATGHSIIKRKMQTLKNMQTIFKTINLRNWLECDTGAGIGIYLLARAEKPATYQGQLLQE